MSDTIHVCQLVNAAGPTSIPADIATGLARHTDVESTVVSWYETDTFEGDDLVDTYSLSAGEGFLNRTAYRAATRLVADLDVDVLHTHHNHAGFYAKLIGRRLGIPVVRTEQNTHDGYTRVGRVSNGLTNPLATHVTCISESVYDSFMSWEKALVGRDSVSVIPNGVNLQRVDDRDTVEWSLSAAADLDDDSLVIGNAAMFTEQKAQDTLLRAVARADDRTDQGLEVVFAGGGTLRESLETLATDLGIRDRVHFVGLLDRQEVYRMMAAVDLFCMPSRWEGFCVAVAEAMAVGTPCILSEIDVFEEIYGDAAVYHPVDDVDALATVLVDMAGDEEKRRAVGSAGYDRIRDRFSMETIAPQYESLFEQLV